MTPALTQRELHDQVIVTSIDHEKITRALKAASLGKHRKSGKSMTALNVDGTYRHVAPWLPQDTAQIAVAGWTRAS
jgi:hypothetical protein